jgi:uncharacterized protein YndB with AHSA1/START domain
MNLPYQLDRIVTIEAPRETVFRFFTDSGRWASWWGKGSTIDPRVGGRVRIVHPGNIEVSGEVLELREPERVVFTYGYVSGAPIAAGGSRVTIRLEALGNATRLHLTHEFAAEQARAEFVQGWRFQLSLFSNAVLNELHAGAQATVDDWFALWAEPDAAIRTGTLARIAASDVRFSDQFSALAGDRDVAAHIEAAQRFMPGMKLMRRGEIRQCQGTVLVDWDAVGPDGSARGSGTNVFVLGGDGRINSATGFWGK